MSLFDIRYGLEKADIYPLPTFVYNKGNVSISIDIIHELANRLEQINNMIRNKMILIKKDLNYSIKLSSHNILVIKQGIIGNKLDWLKPVAKLLYQQIYLIYMVFRKF